MANGTSPALALPLAFAIGLALGASTLARSARASEDGGALPLAPTPDVPVVDPPAALQPGPRPWLYLDDPTTPRPLRVVAHTRATYTEMAPAAKPLALDLAHRGAVVEVGADLGLLSWLALTATAYGAGTDGAVAVTGGVRVALLPASASTHLVLGAGALRELSGTAGAWGSAAFEQDAGRARVGVTARVSHAFAAARDAIDLTASAGASYAVVGPLRAGVEWVGQDLEGAIEPDEAEGGLRHFAGPTASFELLERRLTVVGGPAFGLSPGAPPLVGRLSVAYMF
jgi:hypothetical protein